MRYPGAAWRPIPTNFTPEAPWARNGLVLHCQEGDGSLFGWFSDPAAQVSAHLWVSKTGEVEQYVDLDEIAWAEEAGNESYVSVETEGYTPEPLTSEQLLAVSTILRWGHGVYGWPLEAVDHGGRGLTTHAHYPSEEPDPSWGGHPCPGAARTAQVPEIIRLAAGVPTAQAPAAAHPSKEKRMEPWIARSTGELSEHGEEIGKGACYVLWSSGRRSWIPTEEDLAALVAVYGQPRDVTARFLLELPALT